MTVWSSHVDSGSSIPRWNYLWFSELTRWTKPCKSLELGAGSGKTAILLSQAGYDVTCLDNDQEVIDVMEKNFSERNIKLKTILSDLAIIKGQYDLIYSCGVLEHLSFEKIKETYVSISKHLSPNGISIQFVPYRLAFLAQIGIKSRMKRGTWTTGKEHAFFSMKEFHDRDMVSIAEYPKGFLDMLHYLSGIPFMGKPINKMEWILPQNIQSYINKAPGHWLVSVAKNKV